MLALGIPGLKTYYPINLHGLGNGVCMHTRNLSFSLNRKGVPGRDLLERIQGYFRERRLEPLRFAIVKASRDKVFVEAIVLERGA